MVREKCLRNFVIANIVLKKGANSGLTLYEIATILYKAHNEKVSRIE